MDAAALAKCAGAAGTESQHVHVSASTSARPTHGSFIRTLESFEGEAAFCFEKIQRYAVNIRGSRGSVVGGVKL